MRLLKAFLVVLPLFFPLYFLRWNFGSVPFYVLEGACIIASLIWGYIFLKHRQKLEKKNYIKGFAKIHFAFFLILIALSISAFFVSSRVVFEGVEYKPFLTSLGIIKSWFFFPMLYAFLVSKLINDYREHDFLKRFFLWGAFLLAFFSLIFGEFAPDGRLLGFFDNPNYLALYLAPALVLSVFELIYRSKKIMRIEALVIILALLPALILTRSYAAFIAVFGVLFLWSLVNLRGKKIIYLLPSILILIIGVISFEVRTQKFSDALNFSDRTSTSVRLEIWKVATELWKESPIVGIGPGNFQLTYLQNAWEKLDHAPFEWNVLHTHNLYIQWLTETGLIGFAAFLFLIFIALRRRPYVSLYDLRWVLLTILIFGFFDLPLWKGDLAWQFFMLIGLLASGHKVIFGKVVRGKRNASTKLGFPTINLKLERDLYLQGVYAAYIYWRGQKFPAAFFLGKTLTFGGSKIKYEAHLLDINTNLYGEVVELEVVKRIRANRKFDSPENLSKQIKKDCEKVRKILKIK